MLALALFGCAHLASRSEYVGSYRDQGGDGEHHHATYWSTHLELRADGTWTEKTSTRSPYGTESERHDGHWRAARVGVSLSGGFRLMTYVLVHRVEDGREYLLERRSLKALCEGAHGGEAWEWSVWRESTDVAVPRLWEQCEAARITVPGASTPPAPGSRPPPARR